MRKTRTSDTPRVEDRLDPQAERTFVAAFEDGTCTVMNEKAVSHTIDMADCMEPPRAIYCNIDGTLYPISLSVKSRTQDNEESEGVIYATTAIIANGQAVGHVLHTDH